jgi:hypothetical protein
VAHLAVAHVVVAGQPDGLPCAEVAWLVGRDYGEVEALAFVAAHHGLGPEERVAVTRGMCSDAQYKHRALRELDADDLGKRPLRLDAAGVLSTVEAALAGRPLLASLDGTLSDPTFDREKYRASETTGAAVERVLVAARELRPSVVRVFLPAAGQAGADALAAQIEEKAPALKRVPLEIKRVASVVAALENGAHVVSPDPAILDRCASWFNLASKIAEGIDGLRVVRLQG